MAEPVLERRIDRLDDLMADLIQVTAQTQFEMRAFKDEMRQYRERSERDMAAFKDEMRQYRERSERDMAAFKDEMHKDRVDLNRKWGELSNKLGTMAEDLVAPSVPRILRTVVGCPEDRIDGLAVRVRRRSPINPDQSLEFDVVAQCGDDVLVNETKSRLAPQDVADFVEHLTSARAFFPEFAGKRVIGAIASLYVDASLARHAEKQGLIVLGFGEDVMEVLNSPGFVPRAF